MYIYFAFNNKKLLSGFYFAVVKHVFKKEKIIFGNH